MTNPELIRLAPLVVMVGTVGSVALRFMLQQRRLRKAGVAVTLTHLCAMQMRQTYQADIFAAATALAERARENCRLKELEAHALAGGRVDQLVEVYLLFKAGGVDDAWNKAAAMDLMGKYGQPPRSALEVAREKVNDLVPK